MDELMNDMVAYNQEAENSDQIKNKVDPAPSTIVNLGDLTDLFERRESQRDSKTTTQASVSTVQPPRVLPRRSPQDSTLHNVDYTDPSIRAAYIANRQARDRSPAPDKRYFDLSHKWH